MRYLTVPQEEQQEEQPQFAPHPLRILMVTATPKNAPPLAVEQEWQQLQETLSLYIKEGVIQLQHCAQATSLTFSEKVEKFQPHVVHYAGHGELDPVTGEGVLWLVDAAGLRDDVSASRIAEILSRAPVRLAVLNACKTAQTEYPEAELGRYQRLAAVAPRLMTQVNIPAVVGFQAPISDQTAVQFSKLFYAGLAKGDSFDQIIGDVRQRLFSWIGGGEWGFVVALARFNQYQPFIPHPIAPSTLQTAEERGLPHLTGTWGREAEKEQLKQWLTQLQTQKKGQVVCIAGPYQSGRQALLKWVQEQAATTGVACEILQLSQYQPRGLGASLRQKAHAKPLVLLWEETELTPPPWLHPQPAAPLPALIQEIHQNRLPLLVIATFTTAYDQTAFFTDENPLPVHRFWQSYRHSPVVHWLWLERQITLDQCRAALGQVRESLLQQLYQLGQGDVRWLELLWQDWLDKKLISQVNGRWEVNPTVAGSAIHPAHAIPRHTAELREQLRALLHHFWEQQGEEIGLTEAEMWESLVCATAEGEIFTAELVAHVLGRDPDQLIDLFDLLVETELGPTEGCLLVAVEQPLLMDEVDENGERLQRPAPWSYRFATPAWYFAVYADLKEPPYLEKKLYWQRLMAEQLEQLYVLDLNRVNHKLAQLWANIEPQRSAFFEERHITGLEEQALQKQLNQLLNERTDAGQAAWRTQPSLASYILVVGLKLLSQWTENRGEKWRVALPLAETLRGVAVVGEFHSQRRQVDYLAGYCLIGAGQYEAAEALARLLVEEQRAITQHRPQPADPTLATFLALLGDVAERQGRYEEAQRLLEEALVMKRQVYPAVHRSIAITLHRLGVVVYVQEKYAEAKRLLEEALVMQRQLYPAIHPEIAFSLHFLGDLVARIQKGGLAAQRMLEEALAMKRQLYPTNHPYIAVTLYSLGHLAYARGRYAEAQRMFGEVLAIYRQLYPTNHPVIAMTLHNLGEVAHTRGRNTEAHRLFTEALRMAVQTLGEEHRSTQMIRQSLLDLGATTRESE